jgi:hypothetical protein
MDWAMCGRVWIFFVQKEKDNETFLHVLLGGFSLFYKLELLDRVCCNPVVLLPPEKTRILDNMLAKAGSFSYSSGLLYP